jgi:ketosteroid isomerase-like protein
MGRSEGVAAIRRLWNEWASAYEEFGIEVEEILDLGYGVVLAIVRHGCRPVQSVGHVEAHDAWVYQWVDGMVARVTAYSDQNEGRAAATPLADSRG